MKCDIIFVYVTCYSKVDIFLPSDGARLSAAITVGLDL